MLYTGYLLLFLRCIWTTTGQQQLSAIRCYGTGFLMDASCPANHMMFPVEVLVGSVLKSTGCPDNLVKGVNTTAEALCCSQTDSGCLDRYRNTQNSTVTYIYHVNCIGRQSCITYAVSRATTTGPVVYCDQILYHSTTTLLELKYQCIADNQFLTLSTVGSTTVSGLYDLHVVLQDYGDSGISPLTQQIQCSIETSDCDGEIQIVAKDLRLFSEGGQCYQNLSINETGLNSVQTFSCNENTNFIQNLNFYVSQTNHIILTFMNSYNQSGGYLWVQILPVNFSHSFTVSCPPVEENQQCFPTTTTAPTTTITTTTVDHNDNAANNSSEEEAPKEGVDIGLIIGVVVSIVLLIVVFGIVLFKIYRWNKNRKATKDQEKAGAKDHPPDSDENGQMPHTITDSKITVHIPPRSHRHQNHPAANETTPDSETMPFKQRESAEIITTTDNQGMFQNYSFYKGETGISNQESSRMSLDLQGETGVTDVESQIRHGQLPPLENDTITKKKKKKKKKMKKNKVDTNTEEAGEQDRITDDVDVKNVEESKQKKVDGNEPEVLHAEETEERTERKKKKKRRREANAENDVNFDETQNQEKKKKKKKHKRPEPDPDDMRNDD